MKIIVSTHQGNLYNEEVDYVVVHNDDGEFGILSNHIPVVAVIDEGYVKIVRDKDEFYIVVVSGILEFHDNEVSVLAQEAHIGKDKLSAKAHLEEIHKERLEKNRKEQVDFTQKEKELKEHLRTTKAGQL
ncbi:MAG: ATP synthase F1 subunit epsilon [Anaeroplasmataceae bacterium]|nr:ATP synthase F1 subunit epsilon [Anaeroplasmataceae bacterium]